MDIQLLCRNIEQHTGFECYNRHVRRILSGVLASSNFWKIADYADIPIPLISHILAALEEQGFLKIQKGIVLTERGRRWCEQEEIEPAKRYVCPTCNGKKYPIVLPFQKVYRQFLKLTSDRPAPIQQYDQGYVTPETTIARLVIADERNDLKNRRIVVLGDDDLVSLALALTGLPKEVVVFEIDERIVDYINAKAKQMRIHYVRALRYDLKNPLPEEYLARFDVFFADPPETLGAFRAFIGRGIALLKEAGCSGYFGFTLRDASLRKWQQIQSVLIGELGTVISDIIYNFNEYVNWEYHQKTPAYKMSPLKTTPQEIWYRSSLYRIETLPGFLQRNEPISMEVLHVDEENSTS